MLDQQTSTPAPCAGERFVLWVDRLLGGGVFTQVDVNRPFRHRNTKFAWGWSGRVFSSSKSGVWVPWQYSYVMYIQLWILFTVQYRMSPYFSLQRPTVSLE